MRHVLIRRITIAMSLLLGLCAVGFAWKKSSVAIGPPGTVPVAPSTTPDGAVVFQERCARCHRADDIASGLRAAPDPAVAAIDALMFLDDHYGVTSAENRAIVLYLLSRSR